jgi:DNA primase
MFPICDEQGRVIGFSGRVLSGDEKTAKYVNSPETPIFTKSKVFFGLDKSKRALLDAGFAVVCEGQLDLIACFMAGVQNIVAPQGTAFTADHARIIKRYVAEVVLCFDSDEAGQNAAVRSLDHLLESGLAVRVAVVPAPHDPDSFIKANGGEAFRKLVENAEGFFDYYLNRLCKLDDANSDKGRNAILRGMAEAVHKTGNNVLIDKYAQKTAQKLGVSAEAVRKEFTKIGGEAKTLGSGRESEDPTSTLPLENLPGRFEFALMQLVFQSDEFVGWVSMHLETAWIQHEAVRDLISRRITALRTNDWQGLSLFLNSLTPSSQGLLTEALVRNYMEGVAGSDMTKGIRDHMRGRVMQRPFDELTDLVKQLRDDFIDRQISMLMHRINQPETSETDRIELLRQQQELRQQKRAPLK